ncbi:MAG TPA: MarR family transcriptional regulator [Gaiellaceae bacterium]|nr:MarR family transcriptional regulator [Gaiellaceae bacterium]
MAVADGLRPTLLRLGRELRREKIAGVSPQQVGLLVSIKYAPGMTVGALAADERVSTAAMSKRISRLERDGLVERTPSEKDRRCVGLTLTDEGQRVLRRVRSRRTAWLATRLDALSPADRAALAAAVEPLTRLLPEEEGR